jgi:hypothetical protein
MYPIWFFSAPLSLINSGCGHQEQEQRALRLIFRLSAAVFPSSHSGFSGQVLNPPPPSRSAPFFKCHFEHPLINRFRIKKFPNEAYFLPQSISPPEGSNALKQNGRLLVIK